MQVTDPVPKELDLVAVVSWVVKNGDYDFSKWGESCCHIHCQS